MLDELAAEVARRPEVTDYQVYAGTSAPINFNGLVRQYYLRSGPEVGDIQVNLVDKHHRDKQEPRDRARSAPGAGRDRPQRHGGSVKVVEVPPGPPVQAPLVAEVYGPFQAAQQQLTRDLRKVFDATDGVVDVDDSLEAPSPRLVVAIDRQKAAMLGVSQADAAQTLAAGLGGLDATYVARRSRDLPDPGAARTRRAGQGRPRQRAGAAGALARRCARAAVRDHDRRATPVGQRDLPQGPAAAGLGHRRFGRRHRQPAVRHVLDGRHAASERDARRRRSTSSASPTIRTGPA